MGPALAQPASLPRRPEARPAPEARQQVPARRWALSEQRDGVAGDCTLAGCVTNATAKEFAADRGRHRTNANPWAVWPVYGWVLEAAEPVPFQPVRRGRGEFPVVLGGAWPRTQGVFPFA